MRRIKGSGVCQRIISGTRSYAEQTALFRRGRFGNPPPRVTNARGGQSNHNFGIAWDIGVFDQGRYLTDSPRYAEIAELTRVPGLEWGGDWRTFTDQPHYQIATALPIDLVRQRFEQGQTFV